ncbi:MAG: hypothetical protein A3I26_03125 [Candidatus Yanofskybacteria bacterium RIFCSPLOWO2_02_FULL_43_10]|uniref:EfeO-type cupredoxin-like domain-containing protein n=2 Tax=Parcubacteria group TaxID=1794811 RepID=A0A1G2RPS7_9BACT|nr:MAG: hypothetical protein A2742_02030 [Candidatus Yanofskybacteria bacterium RIFCSPHIGHO2_01_FULL_43_32]OGN29117.1 MAG: hypothetical protein A3I26_03125 [Candidatus Yanofskybacteria bacterium RIFCSPLOWO2_02_FULL_43_10]OGN34401.1 MAG: hypothetical protein A3G51_03370 [Candidatus Yanofskybacteria bacterium RIFCSPLOWO2_12_FULL_43_11b]OHA74827.1 MAG: hypothetical protein A3A32_03170 [Candidatus Wildermuthbacteria bacterium RIFCSPLOWO2_01_FULL_48_35]
MKKVLLTSVVLAVVLVGWILSGNNKNVLPTPLVSPESTASPSPVASENIIIYTDSGYTPGMITIKKGETVVWKNESGSPMWTASAMHPLHRVYPGTDISACGTQTLLPMFDSCAGIASGQSWSFTFNNVGTWGYHNHLNSSKFGTIVVE